MRAGLALDGFRFLVAGTVNTALTFAAYQGLLFFGSHQVSYALAWLCGLAFVIVVYPSRVFGNKSPTVNNLIGFALCYVGMFLLGLITLQLLTNAQVSARVAIVLVLVVTTSANFLIGRLIFRQTRKPSSFSDS